MAQEFDIRDYIGGPATPLPARPVPRVYTPMELGPPPGAVAVAGAGVAGGAAAPMGEQPGIVQLAIAAAEKQKGGPLDVPGLDAIKQYMRQVELPKLAANKPLQQWEFEQMQGSFDMEFDKVAAEYLAKNTPKTPEAKGGGEGFLAGLGEAIASVPTGLVDIVGGIANLADTGVRGLIATNKEAFEAIAPGGESYLDFLRKPVQEIYRENDPGKTILGDVGGAINDVADAMRESAYRPSTLKAQEGLGEFIEQGDTKGAVKHILANPGVITTMLGEVGGGFGLTKLATFMPKVAGALDKLNKVSPARAKMAAASITGTGYAGNAVAELEKTANETPLPTLLENPKHKALYDAYLEIGQGRISPEEAEARLRKTIYAHGVDDVVFTSLVANVALAGVPGLGGIESTAAKVGSRTAQTAATTTAGKVGNVLKRAGKGAASEAGQESIAGYTERVGRNVAMSDPATQGAATEATIGGLVGALAGGGTSAAFDRAPKPLQNRPTVTPTATATPAPATPAAPAAAAAPAATGAAPVPPASTVAATPSAEFAKLVPQIDASVGIEAGKASFPKIAKKISSVDEMMTTAENVAAKVVKQMGLTWPQLDVTQQNQVMAAVAQRLNTARGPDAALDIGASLQNRAVTAAPVAPTPAPVVTPPVAAVPAPAAEPAVPVAVEEQEPDVPEPEPIVMTPPAATAATAAVTETPVTPLKNKPQPRPMQLTAEQKEAQYYDNYLKAILNQGQSTGAVEEEMRADPHFNEMRSRQKAGHITSPLQLKQELEKARTKAASAPLKVALTTDSSTVNRSLIGEALVDKSRSKNAVAAKTAAKEALKVLAPFFDEAAIKAMSIQQAQEAYNRVVLDQKKPEETKPKPLTNRGRNRGTQAAGQVEEVKPLVTPAKSTPGKKLVKGENNSPKTEAPAQSDVAGAASSETVSEPLTQNTLDAETDPAITESVVLEIAGDSLLNSQVTDIGVAIAQARAGSPANLLTLVRELEADEQITHEQAIALRKAGSPTLQQTSTKLSAEDEATVKEVEDDAVSDLESDSDGEPWFTPEDFLARIKEQNNTPAPIHAGSRIRNMMRGYDFNKFGIDGLLYRLNQLQRELGERGARNKLKRLRPRPTGHRLIIARLQTWARNGEVRADAVDFAIWLINKNPDIVDSLSITRKKLVAGKSGTSLASRAIYSAAAELITLNSETNIGEHTIVHEVLHHSERMLPLEVRDGIADMYIRDLVKRYQATKSEDFKEYLRLAFIAQIEGTKAAARDVELYLTAIRRMPTHDMPADFYQYHNTSEYWAVKGPRILMSRMQSEQMGWVEQVKQWFRELKEFFKDSLGMVSDAPIIRAIDNILQNPGTFVNRDLMAGKKVSADLDTDDSGTPTDPTALGDVTPTAFNTPPSKFERFAYNQANTLQAFETLIANILNSGGTVSDDANPVLAAIRYQGTLNDYHEVDRLEVMDKVSDWILEHASTFGKTAAEGLSNINKFFRNMNQLERYHSLWLEHVPLRGITELERDDILAELREPNLTGEQIDDIRSRLESLVNTNHEITEADYGLRRNEYYGRFQEGLNELNEQFGVNEESMTELNQLMDGVRRRTEERMVQSGKIASDDPYVRFYNWKWYVNLRNDASTDDKPLVFSPMERDIDRSISIVNGRTIAAEGQTKGVGSVLEKTLTGLSKAGKYAAERILVDSLYELVLDNPDLFNATIRAWDGVPRDGYTVEAGADVGAQSDILPQVNGFTVHRGRKHYTVDLVESRKNADNSPIMRGLGGLYAIKELPTALKVMGKGTNIFSRLVTTWNPWWTLSKSFMRELTYLPTILAIEQGKNPIKMAGAAYDFYAGFLGAIFKGEMLGNMEGAMRILGGDATLELDRIAAQDPEGFIGRLRQLQKLGGGSNVRNEYNPDRLTTKLTSNYDNARGVWVVAAPGRALSNLATNWANLLEGVGRVSLFNAYLKRGFEPEVAAAKTKDALNFDQHGLYSGHVGAFVPFYKVSMTGLDKMRRLYTSPTGEFQWSTLATHGVYFGIASMASLALGAAMAGDSDEKDEDGNPINKQDLLNPTVLAQNMIIWVGGKPVAIPIGLGPPQLLSAVGAVSHQMMRGAITPSEALQTLYTVYSYNSPIRLGTYKKDSGWSGIFDMFTAGLVTTNVAVVAPLNQLRNNVNSFGTEIHSRFEREGFYKSDQAKPNTDPMWTTAATWLRENAGVDMHPEDLQHLYSSYSGTLARQLTILIREDESRDSVGLPVLSIPAQMGLSPKDMESYLTRSIWKKKDELAPAMYAVNAHRKELERGGMDSDAAKAAAQRWAATIPAVKSQVAAYKALESAQDQYYKDISAIRANKLNSRQWAELQRKKAETKLRTVYERINKLEVEDIDVD